MGSLFFKQEMELTLVGLQNSGKTTLVNVIAVSAPLPFVQNALANVLRGNCPVQTGGFSEDMIPTVGFKCAGLAMRTLRCWSRAPPAARAHLPMRPRVPWQHA